MDWSYDASHAGKGGVILPLYGRAGQLIEEELSRPSKAYSLYWVSYTCLF